MTGRGRIDATSVPASSARHAFSSSKYSCPVICFSAASSGIRSTPASLANSASTSAVVTVVSRISSGTGGGPGSGCPGGGASCGGVAKPCSAHAAALRTRLSSCCRAARSASRAPIARRLPRARAANAADAPSLPASSPSSSSSLEAEEGWSPSAINRNRRSSPLRLARASANDASASLDRALPSARSAARITAGCFSRPSADSISSIASGVSHPANRTYASERTAVSLFFWAARNSRFASSQSSARAPGGSTTTGTRARKNTRRRRRTITCGRYPEPGEHGALCGGPAPYPLTSGWSCASNWARTLFGSACVRRASGRHGP